MKFPLSPTSLPCMISLDFVCACPWSCHNLRLEELVLLPKAKKLCVGHCTVHLFICWKTEKCPLRYTKRRAFRDLSQGKKDSSVLN